MYETLWQLEYNWIMMILRFWVKSYLMILRFDYIKIVLGWNLGGVIMVLWCIFKSSYLLELHTEKFREKNNVCDLLHNPVRSIWEYRQNCSLVDNYWSFVTDKGVHYTILFLFRFEIFHNKKCLNMFKGFP